MKNEFREIVEGVLEKTSTSQPNLSSDACRKQLAEAIEEKVKDKFHIFRINRILTGD